MWVDGDADVSKAALPPDHPAKQRAAVAPPPKRNEKTSKSIKGAARNI